MGVKGGIDLRENVEIMGMLGVNNKVDKEVCLIYQINYKLDFLYCYYIIYI